MVDSIKLFCRLETTKIFYAANLFLPLALLAAITLRPFFVFIRALKP